MMYAYEDFMKCQVVKLLFNFISKIISGFIFIIDFTGVDVERIK